MTSPASLTIRLIMQGKEVGSIIGKKGDNVKKFREESGAKINISDGSCPERIVTVIGCTDSILKAFTLIAQKFEEDLHTNMVGVNIMKPPVALRLIIPASQCGSLIGKGGSKIKDIREATGASIQVASEMLPNSTERAVTVSGTAEAITKCIYQICCVMMEFPPKGVTLPYRPKQALPSLIFAGGQTYALQGQYNPPHPDLMKLHQLALQHAAPLLPGHCINPPQVWSSLTASGNMPPSTASEMTISNDLIGCVIGKGGIKINEIRQISGATIKVSNSEESSKDRTVTINGTPEAVRFAQYLINASVEQYKNALESTPTSSSHMPTSVNLTQTMSARTSSPFTMSLGHLVKSSSPLSVGLSPTFLQGSTALFAANFKQFQAKNMAGKLRTTAAISSALKKDERNKFTPY